MSVTSWKDNKQVNLLSTYCGSLPMLTANRFDKKLKKKINIDCPTVIKEYNRFMGGVDLLDSLIGRYKVRMRKQPKKTKQNQTNTTSYSRYQN